MKINSERMFLTRLALMVSMITVMMLFRVSFARAETKDEIKFRGLEWGDTYEETALTIDSKYPLEFDDQSSWPSAAGQSVDQVINETGVLYNGIYHIHGCATCEFPNRCQINVAGHTTRNVYMYYVYPVVNNEIIADKDDAMFYCAEYLFISPDEPELMIKDLKGNLTDLYGQCDDEKKNGKLISYYWYGANQTVVALTLNNEFNYIYHGYDIKIVYGWYGGDDLLEKAYMTYFSGDYEGL